MLPKNPFDINASEAYAKWRERKLTDYPENIEDLIVEVRDPRALTSSEHKAILHRCQKANMAIYASQCGSDPDKDIPRLIGNQFGMFHLDSNLLAEEDGITKLAVSEASERQLYIPYTNRPIKWHTDGYYNPESRQIRGMLLHCVSSAIEGGENALMDQEMVYLLMRDANPDLVRAFMQPDAMTIPARMEEDKIARAAETGPVFSTHPVTGDLHMRYTARTRSIEWKNNSVTLAAVSFIEQLLSSDSNYIFRGMLEPGMGLICNNVLHDRSSFSDSPVHPRVLYRARYYDRISATSLSDTFPDT
ncbi:TfdA family taurine catabolism dioxygenase TauD [Sulfurirhabdus autotrophica]|uniref:TfdA family taurine catabolism dioxygenase TauD n=1 Tax=Sulfurirhabdus autotrophica TaxID=1706046 RepID=A0A4R3Y3C1_9PROT|nr:TfdA family taurine catabolism dioxygenase TauD [Sulfurirhabdus autotrophica]